MVAGWIFFILWRRFLASACITVRCFRCSGALRAFHVIFFARGTCVRAPRTCSLDIPSSSVATRERASRIPCFSFPLAAPSLLQKNFCFLQKNVCFLQKDVCFLLLTFGFRYFRSGEKIKLRFILSSTRLIVPLSPSIVVPCCMAVDKGRHGKFAKKARRSVCSSALF